MKIPYSPSLRSVVRMLVATLFAWYAIADVNASAQEQHASQISAKWDAIASSDPAPMLKPKAPTKENLLSDAELQRFLELMSQTCGELVSDPGPSADERIDILRQITAVRNSLAAQAPSSNKPLALCNWLTQIRRALILQFSGEAGLTPSQREKIVAAGRDVCSFKGSGLRDALAVRPGLGNLPVDSDAYELGLEVLKTKGASPAQISSFREAMAQVFGKGKPPSDVEQVLGDDPVQAALYLQSILLNDGYAALETNIYVAGPYDRKADPKTRLEIALKGLSETHLKVLIDKSSPTPDDMVQFLKRQEGVTRNASSTEWKAGLLFMQRMLDAMRQQ